MQMVVNSSREDVKMEKGPRGAAATGTEQTGSQRLVQTWSWEDSEGSAGP